MSTVHTALAARGLRLDRALAASTVRHSTLDPYLYDILLDITCLTSLLNNFPIGRTIDPQTFQEIVISIGSRLLRFHSLQDSKQIPTIDTVYHIGLTILVMTTFLQYEGTRVMDYENIFARFREVLDYPTDGIDHDLFIWLMFIGGTWVSGGIYTSWLTAKIRSLALHLHINSWDEIRGHITRFPWINAVHEHMGRSLWDSACQSSGAP